MNTKNVRLIKLPTVTDNRGSLSIAEGGKTIPFKIERTFHTYQVPQGTVRGGHAHKKNEQVYACLSGSLIVTLDDGVGKDKVILKDPGEGLYVGPLVWHNIEDFSLGTVFFVIPVDA